MSGIIIKKDVIREIILLSTFLLSIVISSISNYTFYSFLVKGVVNIILILFIIYDYRLQIKRTNISYSIDKIFLRIIILIIIFPSITLFYSYNSLFGFEKILYLILGTIPVIISLNYLLQTWHPLRFKVFIIIISILGITGVISSLIIKPFEYGSVYKFNLFDWSHVIFGRYIGAMALIVFMYFLNLGKNKYYLLFAFVIVTLLLGTFYSGLRAAALGTAFFIPAYLVYSFFKHNINLKLKIISAASLTIAALIIFAYSNFNHIVDNRYNNLGDIHQLNFNNDPAIGARLSAYKISLERFEKHPVIGLGFGGFRSYYNGDFSLWIKYPHNLFLEVLVETGLIGFTLFLFLLFIMFKSIYNISFEAFFYFVFALWLAMFSKDFPTNSMLLTGIAFIGLKEKGIKRIFS